MTSHNNLATFGLKFHPFPPAATGTAFAGDLWIPDSWRKDLDAFFADLSTGSGSKAAAVVGTYGSGKTYVLHWMLENWFKANQIQPFYIANPGVKFYDLADEVFRQLGRYEFSKAVWQALVGAGAELQTQASLFGDTFQHWLNTLNSGAAKREAERQLADALQAQTLSEETEVSFRFAQMIVGTHDRPYYTFRDFIPRSPTSVVAERQEARYFTTLVRILRYSYGVDGIAFLLDEFEDVALGKRLARRQMAEYSSTIRHLLDTAHTEKFWLVVSITPEGWQQTDDQDPALLQRFSKKLDIQTLNDEDAINLVKHRLEGARESGSGQGMWPFKEDAVAAIPPASRDTPRKLIRIFWLALASAMRDQIPPPIPTRYVLEAEGRMATES